MKQLLLIPVIAALSISSYAQNANFTETKTLPPFNDLHYISVKPGGTAAKTTAVGDTVSSSLSHIGSADTTTFYSFVHDSGACLGTNAFGDKGFAERYDFNPATVTYKVIGVAALFGGNITPTSTKTITFNVWTQGPKTVSFRPTIFNNGLPNTVLASRTVPITQLGIATSSANPDTTKGFLFATPTAYLTDSFFVGYTINYTWTALSGDTLGLYSNKDNERGEQGYFAYSATDTTINNVNVTLNSASAWKDNGQELYGLFNNLAIFPIAIVGPGTGEVNSGITRNNFTFFGNYPNPANANTNIKIALANSTTVSVYIMDMTGKQVAQSITGTLSAGEHAIPVNTSALATGEYIYIVRTGSGDGIASKLVIER